jgi:hypothetical protein
MNATAPRSRIYRLPLLLALVAVTTLIAARSSPQGGADLFKQYKCNACHSVQAQGIVRNGTSTTTTRDLSQIGLRHDVAWLRGWLLKTTELDGRKHMKKFSGPDADLKTLTTWLSTLKSK